jgi:hypothetical protein
MAQSDLHRLQHLLEIVRVLLQKGLTGEEIPWTFLAASRMKSYRACVPSAKLSHLPLLYETGWHEDQHLDTRDSHS